MENWQFEQWLEEETYFVEVLLEYQNETPN